ncbi:MAG: hypothetical protein M3010_01720 [Candidatus Dormibacteraeota bacterium]|nr:hypothetical protein [Candidatus Dormibacteraeota bacterium]
MTLVIRKFISAGALVLALGFLAPGGDAVVHAAPVDSSAVIASVSVRDVIVLHGNQSGPGFSAATNDPLGVALSAPEPSRWIAHLP